MAKFSGYGGSVKVGNATVAEISSWELSMKSDTISTAVFGSDGWRRYMASTKEWEASITGYWDPTDANGQRALWNAWLSGTPITLTLYGTDTYGFAGSAIIEEISVKASAEDLIEVEFSCKSASEITLLGE